MLSDKLWKFTFNDFFLSGKKFRKLRVISMELSVTLMDFAEMGFWSVFGEPYFA